MGKVQHFEVPFDDKDRALKFYQEIFGWKAIDMPEMKYVMVHTGPTDDQGMIQEKGVINGGMYQRSDQGEGPIIVITVVSIDDTLARIKSSGGQIVREKMTVGNMGYYAHIKDSEGNLIGVWENIPR